MAFAEPEDHRAATLAQEQVVQLQVDQIGYTADRVKQEKTALMSCLSSISRSRRRT